MGGAAASRNLTWNDSTKNVGVAAAWADLVAGSNSHWKADVNTNIVDVLEDVVKLVQANQPTVIAVI